MLAKDSDDANRLQGIVPLVVCHLTRRYTSQQEFCMIPVMQVVLTHHVELAQHQQSSYTLYYHTLPFLFSLLWLCITSDSGLQCAGME